jgi:hypothetical protein
VAHLLMLLLFFLDPKRPCMNIIAGGALETGFDGSWRSYARGTLVADE